MKRAIFFSVVFFVFLAFPYAGFTQPAAKSSKSIKIGVVMDRTGSASYYSQESEKGARLAMERINAQGGVNGRKLEFLVEDDQNVPPQSSQKVRKLASNPEVLAVLSLSGSASALQNQVAAEEEKISDIAATNIANSLTETYRKYFFRLGAADKHYLEKIMQTSSEKFTKVTVIGDNTQTGLANRDGWVDVLKKRNVNVTAIEQIDTGATDATPQVLKMRDSGAELVLLSGQGAPELALIVRTIRQLRWNVPLMGGLTIGGAPAFLTLAGESANGILFTDLIDDDKPALQEYTKNFRSRFGQDQTVTANSTLSYDSVYVLTEAMKIGGFTRDGIRDGLEKIAKYTGVSGVAGSYPKFAPSDHQGYRTDAVVIRTFTNQKPTKYKGP